MHLTLSNLSNRVLTALLIFAVAIALTPQAALAQDVEEHKDVVYGSIDGMDLGLDVYVPANGDSPPLVVYVHGGAWRTGSKSGGVPMQFVENGFAVASLDFRASTDAQFPAMVHDIKGAIRFLRDHAGDFGYNSEQFAISGSSSGAHLAALVGVTNGHKELEGTIGGHVDTSSDVQAIISYFGASDLTTILSQSTPRGLGVREPALELLLGSLPEENKDLAELASPVYHVDAADPPLLLFHGDRDFQMPINQSHQLDGAYEALGLDVHFDTVHGAAHGGAGFFDEDHLPVALEFLKRTIGH
jgi:acetyl esterase/lipase